VSVRAIRDIEQGKAVQPRRETVRLIADGLGLTGRARVDFEAAAGRPATLDAFKRFYESKPPGPPAPLNRLVGREAEMVVVQDLLTPGNHRFLTITGLAAVGKTRLALEVARTLHTSSGLPVLWASASDLDGADGSGQAPDRWGELMRFGLDDLLTSSNGIVGELSALIGDHPALLVLDGYEAHQVRAERIVQLLQECHGLRVLATARAPLEARGERTFPLAPLTVPASDDDDLDSIANIPSVQLLVGCARQAVPSFGLSAGNVRAIAALCRRLDGVPLALEAAASWLMVYDPDLLLQHVESDPFGLIGGSPIATDSLDLRELVRQTVDSLDAAERALLVRLAPMQGSWTVKDAVELTGVEPSVCAPLVRRLLIRGVVRHADGGDQSRFVVLGLVRILVGASTLVGEVGRACV
jgi:predicted ATPase